MGIVIITMPGEAKRAFVNALHKKTNGGVSLVIIQRSAIDSRSVHLKRLSNIGLLRLPRELWCDIILHLSPTLQRMLTYFRGTSAVSPETGYLPKVLDIEQINSDEAYAALTSVSPDLLVVWGSKILSPRIIGTAKNAINLHMGRCPKYRGTLANQCAVLEDDIENIGATIHKVSGHVDAGAVYAVVTPDLSKNPRDLFIDLNDRAQATCVDIASRLFAGEDLPTTPQDETVGKNLLMKDWTPSVRYAVAKKMRAWEKKMC